MIFMPDILQALSQPDESSKMPCLAPHALSTGSIDGLVDSAF